jgi:hypothetical protein
VWRYAPLQLTNVLTSLRFLTFHWCCWDIACAPALKVLLDFFTFLSS